MYCYRNGIRRAGSETVCILLSTVEKDRDIGIVPCHRLIHRHQQELVVNAGIGFVKDVSREFNARVAVWSLLFLRDYVPNATERRFWSARIIFVPIFTISAATWPPVGSLSSLRVHDVRIPFNGEYLVTLETS